MRGTHSDELQLAVRRCDTVRCPVDGRAGVEHGAVGSGPCRDPVGRHRQRPAAFVDESDDRGCRAARGSTRSVAPPSSHGMTWWIWQASNGTLQVGPMQVRCIAPNAARCAGVASRCERPTASASPRPLSTTGMMSASHAKRRMTSTGNGVPSSVSQTVLACTPRSSVSRSHSTNQRRHPFATVATAAGRQQTPRPRVAATASWRAPAWRRTLCKRMRHCGPEGLVAHRVERDQRVAHAGLLVGPALDLRRRPLTLQLGHLGSGGVLGGDLTGEIATRLTEGVDALRPGPCRASVPQLA